MNDRGQAHGHECCGQQALVHFLGIQQYAQWAHLAKARNFDKIPIFLLWVKLPLFVNIEP